MRGLRYALLTAALLQLPTRTLAGGPPGDMVIEDFTDIVTPLDRSWNDFQGNRVAINPDFSAVSLRVSADRSALNLKWDFRGTNAASDAFTGFAYSLFGMFETEATFDLVTNVFLTFPEHALDMDRLDGALLEPGGPRRALALTFDVTRRGTNAFHLRVELRDGEGRARFTRFKINPSPNLQRLRWDFNDSTAFKNGDGGDIDVHAVKQLAFVVERAHQADSIANPDQGSFDLSRIAIETDRSEMKPASDDAWMDLVERRACQYFFDWSSRKPASLGIPQDRSAFADLLSPGAVGFALPAYIIAAERKWVSRTDAANTVLGIIRVLDDPSAFGPESVGRIGQHGWFYRFLGTDARRKLNFDYKDTPIDESLDTVEIDPVDTALLLMGVLAAQSYFQQDTPVDLEIRRRAQFIFDRVDWPFMIDPATLQFRRGWKPAEKREGPAYEIIDPYGKGGFAGSPGRPELYDAYSDAVALLTLVASGYTEHQVPAAAWCAWNRELDVTRLMRSVPGSISSFQLLHAFIDTHALHSPVCANQNKVDWYDNSRQAMLTAISLARKSRFKTYGPDAWGVSGTEGPFEQYHEYGFDELSLTNRGSTAVEDGTVTYSAMISAVSFGDDLKERALSAMRSAWSRGHWHTRFGLASAFNDDISQAGIDTEAQKFDTIFRRHGSWVQHALFASQQGLMLLHLENARSGLVWQLLARNLNIQRAFDRLAAPPQISLEAEAGEGDGRTVQRSQAHGVATVQLMAKESRTMSFEITSPASYLLKVRYSNDSYGPPEKIDVILDGEVIDMFKAFDTSQYVGSGSYGSGWNVFVSNEAMGPIDIQPGVHTITLTVRSGDAHGVEIDSVQLEKSDSAAAAEVPTE